MITYILMGHDIKKKLLSLYFTKIKKKVKKNTQKRKMVTVIKKLQKITKKNEMMKEFTSMHLLVYT